MTVALHTRTCADPNLGPSISVIGFSNITADVVLRVRLDKDVEVIRYTPSDPGQGSHNFPWVSKQGLSNGFHVIGIETIEANGQTFNVDYIRVSSDNAADRTAAAEASKGRFPAPAIGALGAIFVVFLLVMSWICFLRQPRKRAEAARKAQGLESGFGLGPQDEGKSFHS